MFLFLLGVISIIYTRFKPVKILYFPKGGTVNNFNNYINNNYIDSNDDKLGYLTKSVWGSKLILVDNQGKHKYLLEINSPFRIFNNKVLYVKSNKLISKSIETNKNTVIAFNVDEFQLFNDLIIYKTKSIFNNTLGVWENELFTYDILTDRNTLISKNIQQFYISEDSLFTIEDGLLFEVSLIDFSKRNITDLEIDSYPFLVMPLNKSKIVYLELNKIIIFDTESNIKDSIYLTKSDYANNRIIFICDENYIFCSFQATKTNGSVVNNKDDPNNGLWQLNTNTLEKEQLSQQVFDSLFLNGNGLLFGTKNNECFLIEVETKRVEKITE